jgi:integrase
VGGHIDVHGKFIEVGRSFRKGVFSSTKSGKVRRVDISDKLAAVIEDHRKAIAAAALKTGKPMPDLAFHSSTWTPMDPSHIRRDFNCVLKKAKLRRIRFHDTRHTFASLLLRKGESPVYVQHQLGHHDISMTVGTYGHLIPGENRQAVNRLDDPEWTKEQGLREASGAGTGNRLATGGEERKQGVRLVCLTP